MDRNKCLEILELYDNPTPDEIKAAYRTLAKKWHPDKNDSPDAKYKFNEIHQAMQILLQEEEEEEVFGYCFDPDELLFILLQEHLMKRYYYEYPSGYSDHYNTRSRMYEEDDSDFSDYDEDQEFLDLLRKKRDVGFVDDDPSYYEADSFKTFEDWNAAQKVKRKQRAKEQAPVRPKQLNKKQQSHLDYQRERESAKIREELMSRMEQVRLKEDRRVQKEEEKRKQMLEETQRNLEETVARDNTLRKEKTRKIPHRAVNVSKNKTKGSSKKGKRKITIPPNEDDKSPEVFSCEISRKSDEDSSWDSPGSNYFLGVLPTCDELKVAQQKRISEVMEKMHEFQNAKPVREEEQSKRVSPSFWGSGDECVPETIAPVNTENLTYDEIDRLSKIQKLRELEQKRNSQEMQEIRAVESYERRKSAMEKRQMEASSPKSRTRKQSWKQEVARDDTGNSRSSSSPHDKWPSRNRTTSSSRANESPIDSWGEGPPATDACRSSWDGRSFFQVGKENVWLERMAAQEKMREMAPRSQTEEELMLERALQLSKIQYLEDEKARFKYFEKPPQNSTDTGKEDISFKTVFSLNKAPFSKDDDLDLKNEQCSDITSDMTSSSSTSDTNEAQESNSSQDRFPNTFQSSKRQQIETAQVKNRVCDQSELQTEPEMILNISTVGAEKLKMWGNGKAFRPSRSEYRAPFKSEPSIEQNSSNAPKKSHPTHDMSFSKDSILNGDAVEYVGGNKSNTQHSERETILGQSHAPAKAYGRQFPTVFQEANDFKRILTGPRNILPDSTQSEHIEPKTGLRQHVIPVEAKKSVYQDLSVSEEKISATPRDISPNTHPSTDLFHCAVLDNIEPHISHPLGSSPPLVESSKPFSEKFTCHVGSGDSNINKVPNLEPHVQCLADSSCTWLYASTNAEMNSVPRLGLHPGDNIPPEVNRFSPSVGAFPQQQQVPKVSEYNAPPGLAFSSTNSIPEPAQSSRDNNFLGNPHLSSNGLPLFVNVPGPENGGISPNNMFHPSSFGFSFLGLPPARLPFGLFPPLYPLCGIPAASAALPWAYQQLLGMPAPWFGTAAPPNTPAFGRQQPQESSCLLQPVQPPEPENISEPEPFPIMQASSNPYDSQPQLVAGGGRGRGFVSKKAVNVGSSEYLSQGKGAQPNDNLLEHPPKDLRLRKRWEKQMKSLSASNN